LRAGDEAPADADPAPKGRVDDALGDLTLATALLAIAGFVDAVGFLTLGHLFVSFASGNSTQFAIAISGVSLSRAFEAGALVGLFVLGVVGGRTLAISAKDWRRPAVLVAESALLGAAALVPLAGVRPAYLMALAMGGQNAVVQKAGKTQTSATYVTGTLVHLGESLADALWSAGPTWAWLPYLVLWIGLVCGGAVGAIGYASWGIRALLIPTGGILILGAATGAGAWRRRKR
jgi:uncharacterized membrane protein YoaK (UPF0700 family)